MARIAAIIVLALVSVATPAVAEDSREVAVRTAPQRGFILNQMRLFLGSVQVIVSALAEGDMKAVAEQAAARGRKGTPLSAIPPGMKANETPAWLAMMGGARAGFDDIAASATDPSATPLKLMGMLGDTMKNCVACHQAYRFAVE